MKKLYNKILYFIALIALSIAMVMVSFSSVKAYVPTLSVSSLSNGNVEVSAYGDANFPVQLFYSNIYSIYQNVNIGYTNNNGYFWALINPSQYNIPSGSSVYITINGSSSSTVVWPYTYTYNNNYYYPTSYSYPVSLSQTSLNLYPGQNSSVSISGGGSYYVYSNSNPYIVSASVSNSLLNIYANNAGSSSIRVCQTYNNNSCATIYVSVIQNVVYQPSYTYPTNNMMMRRHYYSPFYSPQFFFRRWW